MFIIYGTKNELVDDDWSGEYFCPNCNRKTKHGVKLLKKFPTIFFIKIPLGRTLKRYLICNECGYYREISKAEYTDLIQQEQVQNRIEK